MPLSKPRLAIERRLLIEIERAPANKQGWEEGKSVHMERSGGIFVFDLDI